MSFDRSQETNQDRLMGRNLPGEADQPEWWQDKSVVDCPYCFCRFGGKTRSKAVKWLNDHVNARHKGGPLGDGKALGKRPLKPGDAF